MQKLLSTITLCVGALLGSITVASAQTPIPKLIKIIVPFGAGASNDAIARAIAVPLSKRLQTSVIVENKAGASGVIGSDAVAKSPRDGSVLLLTSSTFVTAAATQARLPYDPLTAFAPVAMVGLGPLVLAVSSSTHFKSPADLVSAARAKPGGLTYGTAGVGSLAHMATELFSDTTKIKMTHIPYKGAANALADMAGGQIDVMLSNYSTLAPLLMGSDKLTALAVTSKQPQPAFPTLPSLSATAPGYAIDIWVGVLAPTGTPAALIERLNHEINEIATSPELAKILGPDGSVPPGISPAAFAQQIKEDIALWKQLATKHKIVVE